MNKILTLCVVFTCLCQGSRSQTWCVPPVNASLSFGSGINNVSLNGSPAIDRDSPSGTEGYINTNLSSVLARGGTYLLSVTHSIGTYCADLNIKAYIDFNLDHDFYDAGELIGVVNGGLSGTSNFPFTVPMTATVGTSRMRICEKMTPACGHSPIDPCGPDAVDNAIGGWHGEIEDYTIEITSQSGIADHDALGTATFTVVDHTLWLATTSPLEGNARITVSDVAGKQLMDQALNLRGPGKFALGTLPPGLFLVRLSALEQELVRKILSE